MSKIIAAINSDYDSALRDRDDRRLGALRLLRAALKNKEIALRTNGASELGEAEVLAVLKSEIKKTKEAAELFRQGGRLDLVENEECQLRIWEKYLPAGLAVEEIEQAVKEILAAFGPAQPADFGKIMGLAMKKLAPRADGESVQAVVKKFLNPSV